MHFNEYLSGKGHKALQDRKRMKTHIRRTELTIEFEEVYQSRHSRSFLLCAGCERANARIRLDNAVWLLRDVLGRLESLLIAQSDSPVCLFCLCDTAIENNTEKEQDA